MMNRCLAVAVVIVAPALVAAQSPISAGELTFGEPTRVAEIDTDRTKGQPSRLAWSPDGTQLYIQMMDGQFAKPQEAKYSHLMFAAEGGKKQDARAEPDWLSAYWTAKSGQASPDSAAFKIDLKSEVRQERTVSAPMGGDLARGGVVGGTSGSSTGDAMAAAYNQQGVPVNTMLLHGEVVGEFVNSVIVPGLTFGWGPKGSHAIAYSAIKSGRVVVMDAKGAKQEIPGTNEALLPAWSPDGSKLAWLQKDGRKKYVLHVAAVSR